MLWLLFLALPLPAQADAWIEPYLGYESGHFESRLSAYGAAVQSMAVKLAGPSYGARIGASFGSIAAGAEIQTASLGFKDSTGSLQPRDLGAFANFSLPGGLSLGVTYFLHSRADDIQGSGFKFGLGGQVLRILRLQVDLVVRRYDTYSGNVLGAQLSAVSLNARAKTLLLSLCLPVEL